MSCIIITRPLTEKEYQEVKKKIDEHKHKVYSISGNVFNSHLEEAIISAKKDDLGKETLDFINGFGFKKNNGKTIIEWLSFDSQTYWYYLRFTLYFFYLPLLKERNIIAQALSTSQTNSTIYSSFKHDEFDNAKWVLKKKTKSKFSLLSLSKFFFIFSSRAFLGFFQFLFIWNKKNAIAIEPYVNENIIDINNVKKRIKGDYYNNYLTDAASKELDFLFISDFYFPKAGEKVEIKANYILEKHFLKTLYFEFYFFLALLNPFLLISVYRFRKNFSNTIKSIDKKDIVTKTILRKKNLLTLMFVREKASKMLCKLKGLKTLTCHHEQSYHHFSLIKGFKMAGTKTIGFQHGTIHKEHIHYIYSKLDKKFNPIPDYMITWGEHWKKTLTEHSIYDTNNTVALGQIRTDIIPILEKDKINITPKIDLAKKTILLASQTDQIGINIRHKIATDFLSLSKLHPNLNFVIKPHPRETNPEDYYTNIAKGIGTTNFKITKDDLYLVLNIADAVVTFHSTVASEAVYFKKPVFILNYENNDRDNYLKYTGAFFEAKNIDELNSLIKNVTNNNLSVIKETQVDFSSKFSTSINGEVSQRYIEYIRGISKKS